VNLQRAWLKGFFAIAVLLSLGLTTSRPAAAASVGSGVEQQIMVAVNQDRTVAGLPALTLDPRLTAVAEARAEYLIAKGFFSHCTGGESDVQCGQSGYDFVPRDAQVGIRLSVGGTTLAENMAINNYGSADAAAQTNTAWMNSPEHRANILDRNLSFAGVGVVCCFAGTIGGQTLSASDNVSMYVQEFSGGAGAVPTNSAATFGPNAATGCQFVLGFATVANALPQQVGGCRDNESHNPQNGDAVQLTTTGGMLVWRKADNWTAFTDGYRSWVNGPHGLQQRLNTQRFTWEANPDGLAVVS
jgi:uncharacterized protein YkwD